MNHRSADATNEQLWIRATRCGLSRRTFLQLLAAGGPAAVLSACRKMEAPVDESTCIVVGSGPVGIAAALRLAEQAVSVLVLEAGKSITDPAGSHVRNQPAVREDPDGYFAAIDPYLEPLGEQPNSVLPGLADTRLHGGQGISSGPTTVPALRRSSSCPRSPRRSGTGATRRPRRCCRCCRTRQPIRRPAATSPRSSGM